MNFLELVKKRHSVRNYQSRTVEKEKLDYVMECVRMAPSAVNFQPWKFTIVTDEPKLSQLKKAYSREWIKNVSCIVGACANHEESWHRKADGKDHADIDVAIAVEHFCLAAAEQGLGTCWVCNFDVQLCREIFQLPGFMEPIVLIPVGYAEEKEMPERTRKSLDEILF